MQSLSFYFTYFLYFCFLTDNIVDFLLVKLISFFTNPKLSLKKVLVSLNLPIYENSYLKNLLCLWNVLCSIYEYIFLWKVLCLKFPINGFVIYEMSIWEMTWHLIKTQYSWDWDILWCRWIRYQSMHVSLATFFYYHFSIFSFNVFFPFSETLFSDLNAQFFLFYFCFIWYSFHLNPNP